MYRCRICGKTIETVHGCLNIGCRQTEASLMRSNSLHNNWIQTDPQIIEKLDRILFLLERLDNK